LRGTCIRAEHFNDKSGANSSFSCAAVPVGGWAPQADSRLFALESYWRPDASYSQFFKCTNGMCMREQPADANSNNGTQLGYKCRNGHTGHLCAVCADGYAYQGIYCKRCKEGQRFADWPVAQRAGMILVGVFLLVLVLFFLFFLPLFPRVEELLEELVQPAVNSMERALGTMTAATRPRPSAQSRPMSSARSRPTSAARATSPARMPRMTDDPPRLSYLARTRRTSLSLMRRRSQSIALSDGGGGTGGTNGANGMLGMHGLADGQDDANVAPLLERPSRVRVFFDLIAEPIRRKSRLPLCCVPLHLLLHGHLN
jgi:hypothetical protein